jgi:hypothetical protein
MRTYPHEEQGHPLRQNDSSRGRRAHRRQRPFWLGGCAYAACPAPPSTRGKERRYAMVWVRQRARDGRRRDRRRPRCPGAWLDLGGTSVGASSALYRDRGGRWCRVSLCALPVAQRYLTVVPHRVLERPLSLGWPFLWPFCFVPSRLRQWSPSIQGGLRHGGDTDAVGEARRTRRGARRQRAVFFNARRGSAV